MLSSGLGNMSTARGIQATAGIGRSNSSGGIRTLLASRERPTAKPIAIATMVAEPNPANTRPILLTKWLWNFGDCTRFRAAAQTAVGAGTFSKLTMRFHLLAEASCQRTRQVMREAQRINIGWMTRRSLIFRLTVLSSTSVAVVGYVPAVLIFWVNCQPAD